MRTLFYTVDLQKDFVDPKGSLYVPDSEKIIDNAIALCQFAKRQDILLAGSADSHYESDIELKKNGGYFENHCMKGTDGEKYVDGILLDKENTVFVDSDERIYFENIKDQVIFNKQEFDVFGESFGNKNLNEYLSVNDVDTVVIFGVATNVCVHQAIIGFIKRGIKVFFVEDASRGLYIDESNNEKRSLEQFKKLGVFFAKTNSIIDDIKEN